MSFQRFMLYFGLAVGLSIAMLYGLSLNERFQDCVDVGYYAIPAFSLLSFSIYFLTIILEKKKDNQALLNIVIINVMTKFFVTAVVIALYYKLKEPADGIFVLPFIIVYVVFTIFETYFMSEQARTR